METTQQIGMDVTSIAPALPPVTDVGALLTPSVDIPQADPSKISVYIKEFRQAEYTPPEMKCDEVIFTIVFEVSEFLDNGETHYYNVSKNISVSKLRLLADGERVKQYTPTTVIEEKSQAKEEKKSKSSTQRIRELAGIPHNKNFV